MMRCRHDIPISGAECLDCDIAWQNIVIRDAKKQIALADKRKKLLLNEKKRREKPHAR